VIDVPAPQVKRVAAWILPFSDRTFGTIAAFVTARHGETLMKTLIEILGFWVLSSCIAGPMFTWAFFRFEREERLGRETARGAIRHSPSASR
jgi:hypothetical protein